MKSNRPVWIDTDVALGGERGDVDDGLALAALFGAARRGTTTLAGISTVFGNTSSRLSEGFARRLADVAGIDPVIVCGAERPGETTEAARRISSLGSGRAPDAPDTARIPLPDRIRSRSCLETVPGARWRVRRRATIRRVSRRTSRLSADPVIEAYKKGIDRTLLRENLRLSVEQRLLRLMELQRFADELKRAGKARRKGA